MTTKTARRRDDEPAMGFFKELWSAPVAEARWSGTRPRLSRLLLLLPVAALISAYVAAAAAAHAHVQLAGWLLALAVVAILGLAAAVGRHAHRLARYRAEGAPMSRGRASTPTGASLRAHVPMDGAR